MQREGIKVAAKDTILTPRFYTTDFEECARMFSKEINPRLDMKELEAMRTEFVKDYNQNHFVRNDKFKPAAEWVSGVFQSHPGQNFFETKKWGKNLLGTVSKISVWAWDAGSGGVLGTVLKPFLGGLQVYA